MHFYTNTPYIFESFESFNHSQNYHSITALDDEEWAKEDIKEFTKLVAKFKKAQKPFSEELETINLGTKQEKKELKSVPLLRLKKEKN